MILKDDMRKESKIFGFSAGLFLILAVVGTIFFEGDDTKLAIVFWLIFAFCIFAFLSQFTYKVELYEDKIIISWFIFIKKEIKIKDIKEFTYKKYGVGRFYTFILIANKKYKFYTKRMEEIKAHLEHNIDQVHIV